MKSWVCVRAPVRVLDAGGWTDTWFAGHGLVCHLAVEEGVEVVARRAAPSGPPGAARLRLPDLGDDYAFPVAAAPGRHPLLEAAVRRWDVRRGGLDVTVRSSVPPGSGLGTSAAVVVATMAALHALAAEPSDPEDLARTAHRIETVEVGLQSGVQDQIAAAFGGANLIAIGPYPEVEVRPLPLPPVTWDALGQRVVTLYLGAPHRSSDLHDTVIAHLSGSGRDPMLAPLRAAASAAASALLAGDLDGYGRAMIANTEAQAALHPALVSNDARAVIDVAAHHGAAGWKVNGAGGTGGTVTIVGPRDGAALRTALQTMPGITPLALRPARIGARVVDAG